MISAREERGSAGLFLLSCLALLGLIDTYLMSKNSPVAHVVVVFVTAAAAYVLVRLIRIRSEGS